MVLVESPVERNDAQRGDDGSRVQGSRLGAKPQEQKHAQPHVHGPAVVLAHASQADVGLAEAAPGNPVAARCTGNLHRSVAATFSFLLSAPIILGAGVLQLAKLASEPGAIAQIPVLATGFLAAAVMGYVAIWSLLRYLKRGRLYPFAVYCVCLGIFCLAVAWLR